MNVYHLFAVVPVNNGPDALYTIVAGKSLTDAWSKIQDYAICKDAHEVWGTSHQSMQNGVIVDPGSKFNQEATIEQHRHWCSVQEAYRLVKRASNRWVIGRKSNSWPTTTKNLLNKSNPQHCRADQNAENH